MFFKPLLSRTLSVWLILCATVLVVWSATVYAQALKREILQIGTVENVAPYIWRNKGQLVGLDVDVVKEAAKRAGFDIEFVSLPWNRLMLSLEHGLIDGAMPFFYRNERAVFGYYTNVPLRVAQFHVFVSRENSDLTRFDSFHVFRQQRLGKVRGLTIRSDFVSQIERNQIELVSLGTADQALKLLIHDRLSGVVHDTMAVQYLIYKEGLGDQVRMLSSPVNNGEGVFLVFSRKKFGARAATLAKRFDDVLAEMHRDGTIDGLTRHYVPNLAH